VVSPFSFKSRKEDLWLDFYMHNNQDIKRLINAYFLIRDLRFKRFDVSDTLTYNSSSRYIELMFSIMKEIETEININNFMIQQNELLLNSYSSFLDLYHTIFKNALDDIPFISIDDKLKSKLYYLYLPITFLSLCFSILLISLLFTFGQKSNQFIAILIWFKFCKLLGLDEAMLNRTIGRRYYKMLSDDLKKFQKLNAAVN
jgi:hypothetical protein